MPKKRTNEWTAKEWRDFMRERPKAKDAKSKSNGKANGSGLYHDDQLGLNSNEKADEDILAGKAFDMFSNQAARIGYGTPSVAEGAEYPLVRMTLNYWLLLSLYTGHWIVRRVVDTPAQDMIRTWPKIVSKLEPDDIKHFDRTVNRTFSKEKMMLAMQWGRLFGGAGALMCIAGHEKKLDEPLDLDDINPGAYRGLIPFDRWSGITPDIELSADIEHPQSFGLPLFYSVRTENGGMFKVHESRILRFIGLPVPYPEFQAYSRWGISSVAVVYEDMKKRDNMSFSILNLLFRASILVQSNPELAPMLAGATMNAKSLQMFMRIMQAQNDMLSNQSMLILPKDGQLFSHQYSFGGVSEVYQQFQLDISGASQIPVARLFGRTISGLGQTNDADERLYEERIAQEDESVLDPALQRLFKVVAMSEFGDIPEDFDWTYPSVRVLTEEEKAELAKNTITSIVELYNAGIFTDKKALEEIQEQAATTGFGTNVTPEDIEKADDTPRLPGEGMGGPGLGGGPGGLGELGGQVKPPEPPTGKVKNPDPTVGAAGNGLGLRQPEDGGRGAAGGQKTGQKALPPADYSEKDIPKPLMEAIEKYKGSSTKAKADNDRAEGKGKDAAEGFDPQLYAMAVEALRPATAYGKVEAQRRLQVALAATGTSNESELRAWIERARGKDAVAHDKFDKGDHVISGVNGRLYEISRDDGGKWIHVKPVGQESEEAFPVPRHGFTKAVNVAADGEAELRQVGGTYLPAKCAQCGKRTPNLKHNFLTGTTVCPECNAAAWGTTATSGLAKSDPALAEGEEWEEDRAADGAAEFKQIGGKWMPVVCAMCGTSEGVKPDHMAQKYFCGKCRWLYWQKQAEEASTASDGAAELEKAGGVWIPAKCEGCGQRTANVGHGLCRECFNKRYYPHLPEIADPHEEEDWDERFLRAVESSDGMAKDADKGEVKRKLDAASIRTMSDLDAWIRRHPQTTNKGPYKGQTFYMSRYGALEQLVGEWPATVMLHELATRQGGKAEAGEGFMEPELAAKAFGRDADRPARDVVNFQGLSVGIENPAGSTRSGTAEDGKPWSTTFKHHYGFIKGIGGNDGDSLDCFVGPNQDAANAYVIQQTDLDGNYDEDKVMLGFDDMASAQQAWWNHYDRPERFFHSIDEMPMEELHAMAARVADADTSTHVWEKTQVQASNQKAEAWFPIEGKVEVKNGKPVYTYTSTLKWGDGKRSFEIQPRGPLNGVQSANRLHKKVVEAALAEGKPVPEHVLADYPDLAHKGVDAEAEDAATISVTLHPLNNKTIMEEMRKRSQDGGAWVADVPPFSNGEVNLYRYDSPSKVPSWHVGMMWAQDRGIGWQGKIVPYTKAVIIREQNRCQNQDGAFDAEESVAVEDISRVGVAEDETDTCPKCGEANSQWAPLDSNKPKENRLTRKCEHCGHEYPYKFIHVFAGDSSANDGWYVGHTPEGSVYYKIQANGVVLARVGENGAWGRLDTLEPSETPAQWAKRMNAEPVPAWIRGDGRATDELPNWLKVHLTEVAEHAASAGYSFDEFMQQLTFWTDPSSKWPNLTGGWQFKQADRTEILRAFRAAQKKFAPPPPPKREPESQMTHIKKLYQAGRKLPAGDQFESSNLEAQAKDVPDWVVEYADHLAEKVAAFGDHDYYPEVRIDGKLRRIGSPTESLADHYPDDATACRETKRIMQEVGYSNVQCRVEGESGGIRILKVDVSSPRAADAAAPAAVEEDKEGGRWITLHGVHVYIKHGKIAKGPKTMIGKRPNEIGEHLKVEGGPMKGKATAARKEIARKALEKRRANMAAKKAAPVEAEPAAPEAKPVAAAPEQAPAEEHHGRPMTVAALEHYLDEWVKGEHSNASQSAKGDFIKFYKKNYPDGMKPIPDAWNKWQSEANDPAIKALGEAFPENKFPREGKEEFFQRHGSIHPPEDGWVRLQNAQREATGFAKLENGKVVKVGDPQDDQLIGQAINPDQIHHRISPSMIPRLGLSGAEAGKPAPLTPEVQNLLKAPKIEAAMKSAPAGEDPGQNLLDQGAKIHYFDGDSGRERLVKLVGNWARVDWSGGPKVDPAAAREFGEWYANNHAKADVPIKEAWGQFQKSELGMKSSEVAALEPPSKEAVSNPEFEGGGVPVSPATPNPINGWKTLRGSWGGHRVRVENNKIVEAPSAPTMVGNPVGWNMVEGEKPAAEENQAERAQQWVKKRFTGSNFERADRFGAFYAAFWPNGGMSLEDAWKQFVNRSGMTPVKPAEPVDKIKVKKDVYDWLKAERGKAAGYPFKTEEDEFADGYVKAHPNGDYPKEEAWKDYKAVKKAFGKPEVDWGKKAIPGHAMWYAAVEPDRPSELMGKRAFKQNGDWHVEREPMANAFYKENDPQKIAALEKGPFVEQRPGAAGEPAEHGRTAIEQSHLNHGVKEPDENRLHANQLGGMAEKWARANGEVGEAKEFGDWYAKHRPYGGESYHNRAIPEGFRDFEKEKRLKNSFGGGENQFKNKWVKLDNSKGGHIVKLGDNGNVIDVARPENPGAAALYGQRLDANVDHEIAKGVAKIYERLAAGRPKKEQPFALVPPDRTTIERQNLKSKLESLGIKPHGGDNNWNEALRAAMETMRHGNIDRPRAVLDHFDVPQGNLQQAVEHIEMAAAAAARAHKEVRGGPMKGKGTKARHEIAVKAAAKRKANQQRKKEAEAAAKAAGGVQAVGLASVATPDVTLPPKVDVAKFVPEDKRNELREKLKAMNLPEPQDGWDEAIKNGLYRAAEEGSDAVHMARRLMFAGKENNPEYKAKKYEIQDALQVAAKPVKKELQRIADEQAKHYYSQMGTPDERVAKLKQPIVKAEAIRGGHISDVLHVWMADGGDGIFKPADGEGKNIRGAKPQKGETIPNLVAQDIGFGYQTEREVGAWEVARIAGLQDIVPANYDGKYNGRRGAVQQKCPGDNARNIYDQAVQYDSDKDCARAAVFDAVIGNEDRHPDNWFIDEKGQNHLWLIDHGCAFPDRRHGDNKKRGYLGGGNQLLLRRARDKRFTLKPEYIKPYVDNKQKILDKLKEVGLTPKAIEGVGIRIDMLANGKTWDDFLAPRGWNW